MDSGDARKPAPWYGSGVGGPMPESALLSDSARAAGLRFAVRRSLSSLSLGEGRLYVDCPKDGPGRPLAAERPGLRGWRSFDDVCHFEASGGWFLDGR